MDVDECKENVTLLACKRQNPAAHKEQFARNNLSLWVSKLPLMAYPRATFYPTRFIIFFKACSRNEYS